ncbi:hypothetical protein [Peteryoungia ipomoeae]|uniref:Uncharacterized protein n=1 Tax=Peteryoungia ipomoeae TaxID=1210932 RepID=A0A4S8NZ87_9HYPH|nr:hypothetical protein [Peteryoungia ipomoeae]THV22898.1 hypothetical protein FAA97_09625 [Peteryoungia ipomoeae]
MSTVVILGRAAQGTMRNSTLTLAVRIVAFAKSEGGGAPAAALAGGIVSAGANNHLILER